MTSPVLITTVGHSPAIVTEAIAAHAIAGITFAAIYVITTTSGARELEPMRRRHGALQSLRKTYRLEGHNVEIPDAHVRILHAPDGSALEDISSSADNQSVADQIFDVVRFVRIAHRDSPIFASIAGGRKTMGALLFAAVQLTARPGDRAFHVVLHPALDRAVQAAQRKRVGGMASYQFPRTGVRINRVSISRDDQVRILNIPLIPWPTDLQPAAGTSFSELANQRQTELSLLFKPRPIRLQMSHRVAIVGETKIPFTREQFCWYAGFATLRLSGHLPIKPNVGLTSRQINAFESAFRSATSDDNPVKKVGRAFSFRDDDPTHAFESAQSRIKTALWKALGAAYVHYQIRGKRGEGVHDLPLSIDLIQFEA